MKYEILQLRSTSSYLFTGYGYAKEHGFNLSDYIKVYEGNVKLFSDCQPDDILEQLFVEFNRNRPDDFEGHSLSPSDVVKLDSKYYYCDLFGWKEVE